MGIGDKIAELRKKRGLTQNDLGKEMNVSYQAVSKWERGESQPDFDTISKIAKYFNVPISYFEGDGEVPLQRNENTYRERSEQKTMLGTCTECGRVVYLGEEGETSPKLLCKNCVGARDSENLYRTRRRNDTRAAELKEELGAKWGLKITLAATVTLAMYIFFTVLALSNKADADFYGALTAFIPLCCFGIVFSFAEFIDDLRDKDGSEYCLVTSLVTGAAFAVVNIVVFSILYASYNNAFFLVCLVIGALLSFLFISQFMWGGIVGEIFSAGGFTFKLPGFIFSLTLDSILWMIITKIFLAVVALLVYLVTTAVVGFVAIVGSVITFIPSLFSKIRKNAGVRRELSELNG